MHLIKILIIENEKLKYFITQFQTIKTLKKKKHLSDYLIQNGIHEL